MHRDIKEILFSKEAISARVTSLGVEISRDHQGEDLVLLALLKGSVVFLADLIRAISIPLHLEFAWVSSYGAGTTSAGQVDLKLLPEEDLKGRTVMLVDDILDTGRTLKTVSQCLKEENGAGLVETCVLLDKKARRAVPQEADYVGFPVEDHFVVGYGLDHAGRYRNLPYIGVLKERLYMCSGKDSS